MLVTNKKAELYRIYFENGQHVLLCVDKDEDSGSLKERKESIIRSFNEKAGCFIAVKCRFYGYINSMEVANFFVPKNVRKFIKSVTNL